MLFDFHGTIKPNEFEQLIKPLGRLLAEHGVVEMTNISISFLGWRTDGRAQIVDASGFIRSLGLNGEQILALGPNVDLVIPDGLSIRTRPDELDDEPLAVFTGRDD